MNLKAFGLLLFTTWLITLFLPWWGVLIPAVIFGAWLIDRTLISFLTGFTASGLAWFLQSLYIHLANDAILSTRIAEMMGFQSPWIVLAFTFLIGAIPGGLGCMLGTLVKLNLNQNSEKAVSTT